MTRLGVIGCGHWGPNHVRVFGGLDRSEVVAVADPDETARTRVAAMNPDVRAEDDYRKLLDDARIDAVVVATPTATHAPIVEDALAAGKHVLCEKPLSETVEEAERLVELTQQRGLVVMVGHVFLFNPGILRLKELVAGGDVGSLRYLSAVRTNLGPIRRDVNASYDLAAHDIAIFNWLLEDEPATVSAFGASFVDADREDVAVLSMRYGNGVLASIHVSWLNPKKVRQITLVGSQKMLTWDDLETATPVAVYDKGANVEQEYGDFGEFQRLAMWDGDVRLPKVAFAEPLKEQAMAFLDYIERGRPDKSGAEFSLGVVRVLEAANQSMREDGAPVTVAAGEVR